MLTQGGRTRNFDVTALEQFYGEFATTGTGTFSCTNHAHKETEGLDLTSFPRLVVGESGTAVTDAHGSFAVYRMR